MSATAKAPPGAELSEAAEYRNKIAMQTMPRLQHLAYLAINKHGLANNQAFVFCIQVDSRHRDLVEHFMPGKEALWQSQRSEGADPLAITAATWPMIPWLAEEFPSLADVIEEIPPQGKYKAVILTDGGCTVLEIEPRLDDASAG